MNILLRGMIDRLVKTGDLTLTGADGTTRRFGDGSGVPVHVLIKSRRAERAITLDPSLALPESYMDGEVDIVEGDLLGLMRIVYGNMGPAGVEAAWARIAEGLRRVFRRLQQINTARRARQNAKRHYDLSPELYRLFLDQDRQYSCAYFESPGITLEQAQLAKKRHIAAKLAVRPGQSVLDIGCGFGGLSLYLARYCEADVLGITLSEEQHAAASARAEAEGLSGQVHFELKDYRDLGERFDRIVSVGMFEHVGVNHYHTFFDKCATVLKPDGVMLLHSIGRSGPPAATNPFIRKHIFPGGYIPSLSEVLPAIERSGLIVSDVEILRLHYAETLKNWHERFLANRERIREIYDERFCRMWEYYLVGAESSFRYQDLIVFQIQLIRKNTTLPITRDYMGESEKAPAARDAKEKTASKASPRRRRVAEGKGRRTSA
jgi:cyclopropane-fatty-acyl-phospholipid synthase